MPCHDPRSSNCGDNSYEIEQANSYQRAAEASRDRTEAMLCAVINTLITDEEYGFDEDLAESILLNAEREGDCPGIIDWFKKHLKKDIIRLAKEKPEKPSVHEKYIIDMLEEGEDWEYEDSPYKFVID